MATKTKFTEANFNKKIASIATSVSTQTDNIQEGIEFALEFYMNGSATAQGGNTAFIKKVLDMFVGVKSLANNKLIGYVESCTDLKHASIKIKKGVNEGKKQQVFKRVASGKTVPRKYEKPNYSWNQWTKDDSEKQAFDYVKSLASVAKRMAKDLANVKDVEFNTYVEQMLIVAKLGNVETSTELDAYIAERKLAIKPVKKAA